MKRLNWFHVAGWIIMATILIGSIVEREWWITLFCSTVIGVNIYKNYHFKKKTGQWPFLKH